MGKKPVEYGKVVIGPLSNSFLFIETRTDEQGYFLFDKLYLKDNAKIMINAETKSGNKRNDIIMVPQHSLDMPVSSEQINQHCFDIDVPYKFYRENYYRLIAEQEYEIKTGILLGEVQAIGSKKVDDGHFRLYGRADISMTILDEDIETYFTVLDYLEGRVAGVVVVGDEVRIRGAARNPLLLVDGVEAFWSDMSTIPMGDIDKIEVLKSAYSTSIFGSRGGDGIISILTKMGKGEWENNWVRNVHGRITPTVFGFQQTREFYSPRYSLENINDARPDRRPTLLWNPDVEIVDGNASIEFFTADDFARYHVVVEGISKTGKICSGFAKFAVSIPRN